MLSVVAKVLFVLCWGYFAYWSIFAISGLFRDTPSEEIPKSDVQVRITTIGDSDVWRKTVESASKYFDDVVVITEQELEDCSVPSHVVPDDFSCKASAKGRALEWARREVPSDKGYTLFLDEDTVLTEDFSIPRADIVQFFWYPVRSDSYLSFLVEVIRMGFQGLERRGVVDGIPPYLWGGAVILSREVENDITWNRESLVEDSALGWRATREGYSIVNADARFPAQAPPSLRAALEQRRRWGFDIVEAGRCLPFINRELVSYRELFKALHIFTLPLAVAFLWSGWVGLVLSGVYWSFHLVWAVSAIGHTPDLSISDILLVVVLSPVLMSLNTVGNLYFFVSRPDEFVSTPKSDN